MPCQRSPRKRITKCQSSHQTVPVTFCASAPPWQQLTWQRRGHSTETALLHLMNKCTQPPTPRRSPHWLASTSRRHSTPSTMMCLPAVSSNSSVLSALPPAGYGLISAAVSSSCVLADTRLPYDPVRLWRTAGFSARPAALHCLRVSCWRADRVVRRVIPLVRR